MVLRLRIHWRVRSSGETCGSKCSTTSWVPLSISISCLQTCQVKKLRTQLSYKWDRLLASFRISFHLISSRNRENSSLTLCFKLLQSHLHLAISRIRSLTISISSLRQRTRANLLFNGSRGDRPFCRMDKNQFCRTWPLVRREIFSRASAVNHPSNKCQNSASCNKFWATTNLTSPTRLASTASPQCQTHRANLMLGKRLRASTRMQSYPRKRWSKW